MTTAKKKKLKVKAVIILLLIICMIICYLFGINLLKRSTNNYAIDNIDYDRHSDIDYKVYLKDNEYFPLPYLRKGEKEAYITSLIDYLEISFDYDMIIKDKHKREGNYKYYVKGVISADVPNTNKDYWKEEYILLEDKEVELNNNLIEINETVKVDYDLYNERLKEFKKKYGLTMDGTLTIYLYVDTDIYSDITSNKLKDNYVASFKIPLTKSTIEVPIQLNTPSGSSKIESEKVYLKDIKYSIYKYVGVGLMIFGTIELIYIVIYFIKKNEYKYEYQKKVNKILKTYDGIIVNVENLPTTSRARVINVSSFEELLDAHSELRLPINYCEYDDKVVFAMFNDEVVWYYEIEKEG